MRVDLGELMEIVLTHFVLCSGGSAAAAGQLIKEAGATVAGYMFLMELTFLKGRDHLDAPVYTLLKGQEGDEEK